MTMAASAWDYAKTVQNLFPVDIPRDSVDQVQNTQYGGAALAVNSATQGCRSRPNDAFVAEILAYCLAAENALVS